MRNTIVITTLSFILAPIFIGFILFLSTLQSTLFDQKTDPINEEQTKIPFEPLRHHRPLAVILTNPKGVETLEFLASFKYFSESKRFETAVVSEKPGWTPLTGPLAIYAPHSLIGISPLLQQTHSMKHWLIIPSQLGLSSGSIEWINANLKNFERILFLGEASRILTQIRSSPPSQVCTHFLAHKDLRKTFSKMEFLRDHLYCQDNPKNSNITTTQGIAASLFALKDLLGTIPAANLTSNANSTVNSDQLVLSDYLTLFMAGGFEWRKWNIGVELSEQLNEVALGALLDTWPRTLSARVVTFSKNRNPVRTRNGLWVMASTSSTTPIVLDYWIKLGGVDDPIQNIQISKHGTVRNYFAMEETEVLRFSLEQISRYCGASIAGVVRKIMQVPLDLIDDREQTLGTLSRKSAPIRWNLILRPILIGIGAGFLAWRIRARYTLKGKSKK